MRLGPGGEGSDQAVAGRAEAVADPGAELPGGGPGEGDDEEPLEGVALGHEPGRQGGDGVGLPRAGARLEEGGARGERAVELEGGVELAGDRRLGDHRSSTRSWARRPSHSRRA